MKVHVKDLLRSILGRRRVELLRFLLLRSLAFVRSGFRLKWEGQGQPLEAYRSTDRHVQHNHGLMIVLKHVLRIRPIRRITVSATCVTDGAGHQMLMRVEAFAFARNAGLAYIHTPPVWLHQAERPMAEYCRAWDELFNLGPGNEGATRADLALYDYSYGGPWLLGLLFAQADRLTSLDPVADELRERYTGLRKPRSSDAPLDICIHIRRGWDVTRAREDMWTEDGYILAIIERLQVRLAALGVPFTERKVLVADSAGRIVGIGGIENSWRGFAAMRGNHSGFSTRAADNPRKMSAPGMISASVRALVGCA